MDREREGGLQHSVIAGYRERNEEKEPMPSEEEEKAE